jgi:hypothetical protein
MPRFHLHHQLAQLDTSRMPSTKIKDGSVLVDRLGPARKAAAETNELFFRISEVPLFRRCCRDRVSFVRKKAVTEMSKMDCFTAPKVHNSRYSAARTCKKTVR